LKTTLATLLALCFALAGCNTIKGAGQDIQRAGTAIENAAKK
jgi:predicted small secreted protein